VNVLIRVDASIKIGSGHLMRCLTLADQLRRCGDQVAFVCCRLPDSLIELVQARRYPVVSFHCGGGEVAAQRQDAQHTLAIVHSLFPMGVDWLVVDHYALAEEWERVLRPVVKAILVIDDLADRRHDCDILLDQNFYLNKTERYAGLLPKTCIKLLGPSHLLLRPEFEVARRSLRVRSGVIRRLLLFFGGTDADNYTSVALEAVRHWDQPNIAVDVVVGAASPWRGAVEKVCRNTPNTFFHCQTSNMADLIARADLGIGSGGSSMWERCFLGLPTLTVIIAENQRNTTEDFASQGGIILMGDAIDVRVADYVTALDSLKDDSQRLKKISERAQDLMESSGASLPQIMKGRLR
jgi:UDP-2,4-diacetamido-2,4,6-trideoxy-beta-L-altropyranose hydrolase